ncbi:MAG TPA: hypothetical protein VK463_02400 [Desulfomonilaceae bacterium]|nr:hypothetical protein [Desulfomonilaceae bacterium]
MERLKNLLRQTEFPIFLFFVSLVLFNWPVVNLSDVHRLEIPFIYLFTTWGIVVLLLYLAGKSLGDQPSSEETDSDKK